MRAFLAACALATSVPTAAQPDHQPPPSGEREPDIIVQGDRDRDREIKRFIGALTDADAFEQLTQFHEPVCPAVAGLGAAQNQAVAGRMRRVAAAAGIAVAGETCVANVVVIAAPSKKEAIWGLRSRDPSFFSDLSESKVKELARGPGPVAAWHVLGMMGAGGVALQKDSLGRDIYLGTRMRTRISAPTYPTFLGSVVVIERQALAGLSTRQVADYAALRSFVQADPFRAEALGSATILTLFENKAAGRELPLSLTQWDLSFLKSLYATSNSYYASHQRTWMHQKFKTDLERAEEDRK